MKTILFNRYGGPEVLEYKDVPVPAPRDNEVLIKVGAASVNPVDWKIRQGKLKFITGSRFPLFPGIEVAGTIEITGSLVRNFKTGQRVFAGLGYRGGGYSEYVVVPEKNVILIPDNISFEVASSFAVAGMTPLQAFMHHAKLEEGMHVLINGASGGVGTYAVQIAKIMGLRVTAVCSEKNSEMVRSLGADEVRDYNKEDFTSKSNTYDAVLDAANNKSFSDCRKCLRKNGTFLKLNFSVGIFITQFFSGLVPGKKAKMILLKNNREDLEWIRDHIAIGKIKVITDRSFPLSRVREAHEYSETGRARGKIILIP